MLSVQDNERLVRVGPGTSMGGLLRRYWHPIASTSDLLSHPTKRVRLLGEDLVLFRDRDGHLGLLPERCPHRGASLAYGTPTCNGIRCPYHGWEFHRDGRCLDQPNEPGGGFCERIQVTAHSVQDLGGLIFGYIGPAPAPELPPYDLFVAPDMRREIRHALIPCNWLQIVENSLDPTHLEWLHGQFFNDLAHMDGKPPVLEIRHHEKLGFEQSEWGIVKRRLLTGQAEGDEDWRMGQILLFPLSFRIGTAGGRCSLQIRVPVDDVTTWMIWYECAEDATDAVQDPVDIPYNEVDYLDVNGEFRLDTIEGQDIMAWVTAGEIADRSLEHLGRADEGILLYRKLLRRQLAALERGEDPLGVLRQPPPGGVIALPRRTESAHVTDYASPDAEWVPRPCE